MSLAIYILIGHIPMTLARSAYFEGDGQVEIQLINMSSIKVTVLDNEYGFGPLYRSCRRP